MAGKQGLPPFIGGRNKYRVITDLNREVELDYKTKVLLPEVVPPYQPKVYCFQKLWRRCKDRLTPEWMEDVEVDFCAFLTPCVIISFTVFIVFILPWLPMVVENSRSCNDFAPSSGIKSRIINENDLSVSQYIMGFDKDRVMRSKRQYSTYLYSLDMQKTLAQYDGDSGIIKFSESDPLCSEPDVSNDNVHFCLSPKDNEVPGAPKNKLGEKIIIHITSPQLENFSMTLEVDLRKRRVPYPNMIFTFDETENFPNIQRGTTVTFTSSKNSAVYLRRTFYEYGEMKIPVTGVPTGGETDTIIKDIAWPGAFTPIISVGKYSSKFGINHIPKGVEDDGKFHRLCVPTQPEQNDFLRNEFENADVIEFFERVMYSQDVAGKVAFHTRATSLYRDFTGNNRAFKVSISIIVIMFVLNVGILALENW